MLAARKMFRKKVLNLISKPSRRSIGTSSVIKMPFTDEDNALRKTVRNFVDKEVEPQATEFNREEKFNRGLFNRAADLGLLGITADPNHGGLGLDATAACIVHHELARSDPGFCVGYLAHSILFVNNLSFNGNEEQKARILPKAIDGTIIGGMGMTEPSGGTDVLGMKTNLVPASGSDWGGDLVLNGSKMWITNGTVGNGELGDCFLVYAKTSDHPGLSMVIVEKGMEGFTLGREIKGKCGIRATGTAELSFSDVKIPKENVVGKVGKATMCLMRNLEIERLALAAIGLGIAERSIKVMVDYASQRTAFGKPIEEFGQIQRLIGKSFAEYQAGQAYVYMTAAQMDLWKANTRLDSDGVKLYTATMAKNIADRAMQVLGGNGYVDDYVVERLWRDAKLGEIGGGTKESHHKNITTDLSQGNIF
jgi:isovaleryl-CoA dehydrogenase